VADDTGGTIWRVAYTGAKPGIAAPASPPPARGNKAPTNSPPGRNPGRACCVAS
jgi:hypothetical protein